MIVDTARLSAPKPAPGGGIVVSARIGRSGVQVYRRPDGTAVRAYRPAEEVQAADFTGAPVTIGHPSGGVTPETYQTHSVGHVRSQDSALEQVGKHGFARAELQLNAQHAIHGVRDARKITECSCAYTCDKDPTPGVTADGEAYDVVFRAIRPNHVALGADAFARAGRDARVLLADGETDADVLVCDDTWEPLIDDATPRVAGAKCPDCGREMSAYCADCYGVHKRPARTDPQETREDSMVDQKEHDKLVADHAALQLKYDDLVKASEVANGRLAAADGKVATLQAQVDGLPKAVADGVQSELAFRSALSGRLPEGYDPQGKSTREVKIAAIKHAQPTAQIADSASDDFVDAYFQATAPSVAVHDHNVDSSGKGAERTAVADDYQAHMRAVSAELFSGKKG